MHVTRYSYRLFKEVKTAVPVYFVSSSSPLNNMWQGDTVTRPESFVPLMVIILITMIVVFFFIIKSSLREGSLIFGILALNSI